MSLKTSYTPYQTPIISIAALTLLLSGCGGGGGSSVVEAPYEPVPIIPVAPPPNVYSMTNQELSGADYWHDNGFSGESELGVKSIVSVLDSGTDNINETYDTTLVEDVRSYYTYSQDWVNPLDTGYLDETNTQLVTGTHGHAMSEVIGSSDTGIGIAPDAQLIHGVISDSGYAYTSSMWNGLKWANDHNAVVANLSFEFGALYTWKLEGAALEANSSAYTHDRTNQVIHNDIVSSGMAIVHSGGNSAQNLSDQVFNNTTAYSIVYSEIKDNLIIAGALNESLTDKASFSAYAGDDPYVQNRFLLAPGSYLDITLSTGQEGYVSGTSPAAAYISGSIATMKSRWTTKTGAELANILLQTADKNLTGYDPAIHGVGKLDLVAAWSPVGETSIVTQSGQSAPLSAASFVLPSGYSQQSFKTAIMDSTSRDFEVTVPVQSRDYQSDFSTEFEMTQKERKEVKLTKLNGFAIKATESYTGYDGAKVVGMNSFTKNMFTQPRALQEINIEKNGFKLGVASNILEQSYLTDKSIQGNGIVLNAEFNNIQASLYRSSEEAKYAFYGASDRQADGFKIGYRSDLGLNLGVAFSSNSTSGDVFIRDLKETSQTAYLDYTLIDKPGISVGFSGSIEKSNLSADLMIPKSIGNGYIYQSSEILSSQKENVSKGLFVKMNNVNLTTYSDNYDSNVVMTYQSKF